MDGNVSKRTNTKSPIQMYNLVSRDRHVYKTISNKNYLKAKNNFHSKELLHNLVLTKNKHLEINKWCAS